MFHASLISASSSAVMSFSLASAERRPLGADDVDDLDDLAADFRGGCVVC